MDLSPLFIVGAAESFPAPRITFVKLSDLIGSKNYGYNKAENNYKDEYKMYAFKLVVLWFGFFFKPGF